jgi:predicted small lipoprotein YifL
MKRTVWLLAALAMLAVSVAGCSNAPTHLQVPATDRTDTRRARTGLVKP